MKIAVIGAGNVGATLGLRWADNGHAVAFGAPDPAAEKYERLRGRANVTLQTPSAAATGADVIVLATPWDATQSAIESLGDLQGRIIIDCTNPIAYGPQGLYLTLGFSESGGERVAQWAKGAHVFKTLNQVGFNVMADPSQFPVAPMMYVAGDDAAGKRTALSLVGELGFDARDAGPLTTARLLEPLAMFWIQRAATGPDGRDFSFAHVSANTPS
ncbi:MAG: F420-dependent NADP oxidoreductase [Alphaproteobacteria bacterium]|nr:F420-dependent NADP oxidoreductase [Alphaproteobacteria bacterium]